MTKRMIGTAFLLSACLSEAEPLSRLSLNPATGMTRADLYHVETVRDPKAVLVLAPGCNGDGVELVSDSVWQAFAKKQHLGLVGLSFASEPKDLQNGTGYYYAAKGSGSILRDGITRLFGRDLPILLYGFSGGAQFTSRFVEWNPECVVAWCAYSAGWWDNPQASNVMPPGIVACGEGDQRLGASLVYFKQGRAVGKPWLWIGIPKTGHSPDASVESFMREYFVAILDSQGADSSTRAGLWVDIDRRSAAQAYIVRQYPSVTGWLPDAGLLDTWRSLNEPRP